MGKKAVISTTKGDITVELNDAKAPITTANFVKYANDGFYDGLVFHRVIDGFMIQGGGFEISGDQKAPIADPITLECHKELRHDDGAIAMARTNDPNSATGQFFIDDGAQNGLNDDVLMEQSGGRTRGYAVFGIVVEGIEVVRAISEVATGTKMGMGDWPVEDVVINSVRMAE